MTNQMRLGDASDLEAAVMERSGKRRGNEISFLCPFHDDSHPSCYYQVEKRVYHCVACDASGGEKALREALGLPTGARASVIGDGWPAGIPRRLDGADVVLYRYRDTTGGTLGYVVRSDPPAGKAIRQFFGRDGEKWTGKAHPAPRPLYGLHRLRKYPDAVVYVVEGEKCVDAMIAHRILAVTSPGGSSAWSRTDWSPLTGREVVIWPDNDAAGKKYAKAVCGVLLALGCRVSTVDISGLGLEPGGDCADWLAVGGRGKADVEALPIVADGPRGEIGASPKVANCDQSGESDGPEWTSQLLCSDTGIPKLAIGNLLLIFSHDPAWSGVLGFDERSQVVVFRKAPPVEISARVGDVLLDSHVTEATIWLQTRYRFSLKSTAMVHSAMVAAAHCAPFDPVCEWLEGLPRWDGTARADLWLSMLCGCPDTVYTRAVGSTVLISAVARAMDPGCKVDTLLVLTGPQGTLKSSLLEELAGRSEWFTDHVADIGGKDAALQICGPWIVEFSELDAITGKRESERVKAWITQRSDRFRPPYGRSVVTVPRRAIFTGTSNLSQFLRDETGGRRFLPVEIREIDLDGLRRHRDQLWAEALHRYRAGEKWWLEGEALAQAKVEQEDRRIGDPWEDVIAAWLADTEIKLGAGAATHSHTGRRMLTHCIEILSDCLKVEVARQTKSDKDRIAKILKRLGWVKKTQRVNKVTMATWVPPPPDGGAEVVDLITGLRPEPESTEREGY